MRWFMRIAASAERSHGKRALPALTDVDTGPLGYPEIRDAEPDFGVPAN